MAESETSRVWLGPPANGRGRVIVVSGPSGAGKSTLARRLARDPNIHVSISATTRAPGPGEQHGVDYYFVSRDEFEKGIAAGDFLEHAEYGGQLYGTPVGPLVQALRHGKWCLLEIEIQGARQVRQLYPDAIMAFIEPPSEQVLHDRLANRKRDDAQAIQRRMAIARQEMEQKHLYDFCVVNDDLETATLALQREIRKRTQDG